MTITINRLLAVGAVSAFALLSLAGCGAAVGDGDAPANDQSSARAVAESYFQDIEHMDSTKLSAILDKPLSAKELASMKKSVELWGKKSPYTDFKIASSESTQRYATDVRYTYKYNGKLVKGTLTAKVDPTVDDSVWMIADAPVFTPYANTQGLKLASNTVTINKQQQRVNSNTRVFPGIPFDQKMEYVGGLYSPTVLHSCGFLGGDQNEACTGGKYREGSLDEAKLAAKVQDTLIAKVKELCNHPALGSFVNSDGSFSVQGDAKGCTTDQIVNDSGEGFDKDHQSVYTNYAAAGSFYQPVTDPKVEVGNGGDVTLTGGQYKAYDLVAEAKFEGVNYDSCTAFTCDREYSYTYKPQWSTQTYDNWGVDVDQSGVITGFQIPDRQE